MYVYVSIYACMPLQIDLASKWKLHQILQMCFLKVDYKWWLSIARFEMYLRPSISINESTRTHTHTHTLTHTYSILSINTYMHMCGCASSEQRGTLSVRERNAFMDICLLLQQELLYRTGIFVLPGNNIKQTILQKLTSLNRQTNPWKINGFHGFLCKLEISVFWC